MKRTNCLWLLACLLFAFQVQAAKPKKVTPMSAYLFAYFPGNAPEKEQICFALSHDGYNYTPLNNGRPIVASDTIAIKKGVRDPHILRGEDGNFYMVVTDMRCQEGWDSNRGIVMMKSPDLVHWTHHTVHFPTRFAKNWSRVTRVWAPQTIWDPQAKKYMIYFSLLTDDGTLPYDQVFYCYANADFTDLETEPVHLFDRGAATIDSDIIWNEKDKLYHYFYKTENEKGICKVTSPRLTAAKGQRPGDQWQNPTGKLEQTDERVEGVGVFKTIDNKGWIMMYDCYINGHYQFCSSNDLIHFKFEKNTATEGAFTPRHGTTIAITAEEEARLLKAFPSHAEQPDQYTSVAVKAPFEMQPLSLFVFPNRDFNITDFGAKKGDVYANTIAFKRAMEECNAAGGGRVVVPQGTWLTSPIHFQSNVNLHLMEGAVVNFTDNPKDYLPAVPVSWEGFECYNYSPLVYAYNCKNIAITGKGTLQPIMDTWKVWFARPQAHLNALRQLYAMASTDVPVKYRQMAEGANHLRPHLIHFNRCTNVQLDSFAIKESPFWTIHLYMCKEGRVSNLNVFAHGHNNDGVDLEMSSRFLVENCSFDQGDDAVVIKAGRNQDAWRLHTPCENIVVKNCVIKAGHCLLGIGSEISGGVRNVYMSDCQAPGTVHRLFFLKTNVRRGGFLDNIIMENVTAGRMLRAFEIDTDVLYQWKDIVPTFEEKLTKISNIRMKNIQCEQADAIFDIKGDVRLPISGVSLENIHVNEVSKFIKNAVNVNGLTEKNISYDKLLQQ